MRALSEDGTWAACDIGHLFTRTGSIVDAWSPYIRLNVGVALQKYRACNSPVTIGRGVSQPSPAAVFTLVVKVGYSLLSSKLGSP